MRVRDEENGPGFDLLWPVSLIECMSGRPLRTMPLSYVSPVHYGLRGRPV